MRPQQLLYFKPKGKAGYSLPAPPSMRHRLMAMLRKWLQ